MSVRAPDLLSRYDRAHEQWTRRVAAYDAAAFLFKPGGKEWSVAEVVDHLRAVQEKCLAEMDRCLTGDGEYGRSRIGPAIFSLMGSFPPIRIRVREIPPGLEPVYRPRRIAQPEALDVLRGMGRAMHEAASRVATAPEEPRRRHWAGGWFNAAQWYQACEMHLRHHFRQLRRIDRALGRAPAAGRNA